jgi:DHA2 family multidrug resistance protein
LDHGQLLRHWIFYINIPVGLLTLFLTNRLVEDPPYQKADRKNFFRIDYIGVSLLVISMAALQITLDKGEEKNWFGSHFIVAFATTFILAFIALIIWEFNAERPLIDLRLFKFKNFAVCAFLMLLTGGLLNATTVLQPQFLQQQLGYTATIAGLSLSGGGLALLVAMPMAGQAVSRFPARNLIAMGFVIFAFGYFYTARHISLLISFGFASELRVIQIIAIPFVFISVTTAAYFGIPPEKNNQVSGLINFVRNIGGSILISLTNALVTERAQFHQDVLSRRTSLADSIYQQQVDALRNTLDVTAGKANGLHLAQGQLYQQLQAQTQALAYVDVYYVLAFAAVLMVPLSFLLSRNQPGGGGTVMME